MTPADFKRPTGELNPVWFEDLDPLLEAALVESIGESPARQRAFVYWRAYQTLVADLMSAPISLRADDISETRSDQQLAYWQTQAAAWRAKYDTAITTPVAAVGVAL